jgi:alpha/beta superfamily hydrolase
MVHTRSFVPLILMGALACMAQGPEIDIVGSVTDMNGSALKNAKVALLGRNLSTFTDAAGKYAFRQYPAALRESDTSRLSSPSARFFDVAGRFLMRQTSQIPPFPYRSARHSHPAASSAVPYPYHAGNDGAAAKNAAGTATVDTLSVMAMGYERGERLLPAWIGTQDFKLNAVKFTDVPYKQGELSAAEKTYCLLDIHKPASGSKWPVVVHFHGGGMVEGDKTEGWTSYHNNFAYKFLDAGFMMVMPNYRLIGKGGTWPGYIQDAAAAAAWVRRNIEPYGGDPENVFISGWSAGAYLTQMLFLDTTWLAQIGNDAHRFRGFIALSGQTRSHSNLQGDLKVANIMAEKPYAMPMGHIRKTDIPFQIFVGGKEGGTITDNRDLYDQLIKAGSTGVSYNVIADHAHNDMGNYMGNATDETRTRFLEFLAKYRK